MKRAVPVFLFAVLIAVFIGWVPNAGAYSSFSNCRSCHSIFSGPSVTHDDHAALAGNTCSACHGGSINNNPSLNNCTQCHGRTQDAGADPGKPGLGRGLRQHHQGGAFATCTGCHGDATGPPGVGENVPPSFYPGPANLNPCDGSEEQFPSNSVSLDNDGDGLTDGADPDCQAGAPQIDVNPASKDYGNVTVGSSASQVFTVSNTGTADLAISDGVLSGDPEFVLDPNGGTSPCGDPVPAIAPGNSCTVSIAFSPQAVASYAATVTVTSNSATNSTLDIALTGNGVTGPAPNIVVDPTSVDFDVVNVGDTPATEVTISNTGNDNLVVSNIVLDNTAVYSLDTAGGTNPCGSTTPTIVPTDNCTLDVVFTPVEDGGPFTATMTITSNAPSVNVPITGNGFLDTDGDGVGDSVDNYPNDPSKATPMAATGTGKIEVDATPDTLSNVAAVALAPGQAVSGFTFPDGLVTFQVAVAVAGDNAVVTLKFPSGQPSGGKYFKDDGSGTLVEFAGATINADNVVLMLTDGGSGDNDNTADAMINDPGGLATPVPAPSGGGGGGGCSVSGPGGGGNGGAAVIFLTLLAILVALRRKGAIAKR